MKTVVFILIAALALNFSLTAQEINLADSALKWYGKEISGKEHYGSLKFKSGSINVSNGKLTGGAFEIDMTSLE